MSLLGIVRHMADVERSWFRRVMGGLEVPPMFYSREDRDGDFDGARADPAVVEQAWAAWREEVAFADEFVLTHMIEEYARHVGHADLLRERIDGAVGQ